MQLSISVIEFLQSINSFFWNFNLALCNVTSNITYLLYFFIHVKSFIT